MGTKQVDKVVKILQKAMRIPTPLSGKIINANKEMAAVSAVWSQASPDRETNVHSESIYLIDRQNGLVKNFGSIDTSTELLTSYSPSNNYRAVLRDVPSPNAKQNKRQILEIWSQNVIWKSFDLVKFEKHGDVYTDGEFACLEWSPCETKLLYVAEKKTPKSEPFLGPGSKKSPDASVGTEFDFTDEWGEILVGKSQPVIVICDIETEAVEIVEGETSTGLEIDDTWSLGQAVWAPDGAGIVCVAWDTKPRRLGLVYCTNRKSFIIHICVANGTKEIKKLSEEGRAVRSPVFSPDMSKLVWLERDIGGPHHACHKIVKYDWDSKKMSTVVDIIDTCNKTENGEPFYGIYSTGLNHPWLSDNKTLILSTPQRASIRMIKIDTDNGNVVDISGCQASEEAFSEIVLDVSQDLVLFWRSSMALTPALILGRAEEMGTSKSNYTTIAPSSEVTTSYHVEVLRLKASRSDDSFRDFSAIYFGPCPESEVKDVPLIVWPHGGPHSLSTNTYSMMYNFFAQLGFAILLINYRGSVGAGQASVDWLLGKIGSSDVEDVHQATLHLLHKYSSHLDSSKTVLYGGSHGGFIVLQLAGQHPTSYHCVTALNPVTDLLTFSSSDIPDWAIVESGFIYDPLKYDLTTEEYKAMCSKSPLVHVDCITAPILFALGKKDLRVPANQGFTFYHALKARQVETRALFYEDVHSIVKVPHVIDCAVNSANWFLEHIKHKLP